MSFISERAFTAILRLAAILAPIITLLSRVDFESFPAGFIAFLAADIGLGNSGCGAGYPIQAESYGIPLHFLPIWRSGTLELWVLARRVYLFYGRHIERKYPDQPQGRVDGFPC